MSLELRAMDTMLDAFAVRAQFGALYTGDPQASKTAKIAGDAFRINWVAPKDGLLTGSVEPVNIPPNAVLTHLAYYDEAGDLLGTRQLSDAPVEYGVAGGTYQPQQITETLL